MSRQPQQGHLPLSNKLLASLHDTCGQRVPCFGASGRDSHEYKSNGQTLDVAHRHRRPRVTCPALSRVRGLANRRHAIPHTAAALLAERAFAARSGWMRLVQHRPTTDFYYHLPSRSLRPPHTPSSRTQLLPHSTPRPPHRFWIHCTHSPARPISARRPTLLRSQR